MVEWKDTKDTKWKNTKDVKWKGDKGKMKGKKDSIEEIASLVKHLRKRELAELEKKIDKECSKLSPEIHIIVEKAGDIATKIANFKGKK